MHHTFIFHHVFFNKLNVADNILGDISNNMSGVITMLPAWMTIYYAATLECHAVGTGHDTP